MRKKFISALLFGALAIASTNTLVSCKDYDDDISSLREGIDANSKAIQAIQDLIKNGSVITGVTKSDNGVTVTLSNNETFTISNGSKGDKGDPGTAWTIGDDGFWYKDGVKTSYYALGTKGDKGDKGDQGETGPQGPQGPQGPAGSDGSTGTSASTRYYVPNPETGCFDIYENGNKVESTNISFLGSGTITAVKDGENLTLYGVKGTNGAVVISLTGDLRSLVFVPNLYFDGIETIEYPWLNDTVLNLHQTDLSTTTRQNKKAEGLDDYATAVTKEVFNYGPAWGVDYHMNPANANTKYADVVGFNVLEPDVYYYNTRAGVASLGVTSPEKNAAGENLFLNSNGYLTAGLQIKNPQLLNDQPTDLTYQKDNTIALQVKSKTGDGAEGVITSDYALLLPSKCFIDGLTWVKAPMYAGAATQGRVGDELCDRTNTKVHVYDTPQEALADKDGAALEVYFDSEKGINLSEYLGIHYVYIDSKTRKSSLKTWAYGEEKEWGLSYEFNLVDYSLDGNATRDSRYAKWVDQKNGQVRAWNVKYDGTHADGESATSIDREPLVQVLVKNADGKVVLDGYILIHITKQPVTPAEQPNKEIALYPAQDAGFNLCDAADVFKTNWSMFSDYVLTQGMDNMTKEEFDAQYEPDLSQSTSAGKDAYGVDYYKMNIYENAPEKGDAKLAMLGDVFYYPNADGTTNHRFYWAISAEELEALTHDKAQPVAVTRYIRFKAKTGSAAQYPYVFIKMTVNITRAAIGSVAFGDKNDNYWYGLDGSDAGWDAIVFDVKEPTDGGNINTISHGIRTTLVGNAEKAAGKYYFIPKTTTVKSEWDGKTYTITAASSASDVIYNNLFCKWITTPVADKHAYDEAKLNDILNACTIDYAKGAFANNKLYAIIDGTYTEIAELNQSTGAISLKKNNATKAVLNAIGYAENHANINTEMRTWVGFVAQNSCGVAKQVTDGAFLASWQRPINMKTFDNQVAVDANTNGNIIYVLDFLKLFDWRGEKAGYMWGDQQWFWAYYNVNAITVNTDPSVVTTNMHNGDKFVPLNNITTEAALYSYSSTGMVKGAKRYPITTGNWNAASKNEDLLRAMGISPRNESLLELFGAIYYANNGDNVTEFDLRIPVTVEYEWGSFTQTVQIHINRTTGH